MVMPGATTRKAFEKRLELGDRTAFSVCQAISMAITVVLPAPVASLKATRARSGLAFEAGAPSGWSAKLLATAIQSRNRLPRGPACGATSASQIAASTASSWQKKGRTRWPSSACSDRQCCSSRCVVGLTIHCDGLGSARQAARV